MYRSILLAVDGSDFAAGAAPLAARLAADSNATLHIVLVHEWLSHWTPLDPAQLTLHQIDEYGRRQSKAYLRQLGTELRATYGIRVRSVVLEGIPAVTGWVRLGSPPCGQMRSAGNSSASQVPREAPKAAM